MELKLDVLLSTTGAGVFMFINHSLIRTMVWWWERIVSFARHINTLCKLPLQSHSRQREQRGGDASALLLPSGMAPNGKEEGILHGGFRCPEKSSTLTPAWGATEDLLRSKFQSKFHSLLRKLVVG